jgi:fluoride exporter
MIRLAIVFLGGGIGSVLRYLVAGWVQSLSNGAFPLGTLTVNLVGCALIGFLAPLLTTGPVLVRPEYRLAILVGLLGGFTTFSSFAWETVKLTDDSQWLFAIANIVASNAVGLTFAWLGTRLVTRIYGS